MQLNLTTDYAIRILICLKDTGNIMSGGEIAEQMKIPPKYLLKVTRKLREEGLLGTAAGVKGGYYLTRDLDKITLLEILRAMEPTTRLNRCLEDDSYCSRGAAGYCQVRKYYQNIQEDINKRWLSRSLKEIITLMDLETARRRKICILRPEAEEKGQREKPVEETL